MESRIELLWSKYYAIVNNTPEAKEQERLNARFNNRYMQNTKEEIEAILIQMGLTNISFNLPIKSQMDSLDMTALIIAVEDEWHISISDEDQYRLPTLDDLVKLIHAKTEAIDKHIPTINEQIHYMDVLLAAGQRPNMVRAIKENLIAVRVIKQTRTALIAEVPISETEAQYLSKLFPEAEKIEVWKGGPTATGWVKSITPDEIVDIKYTPPHYLATKPDVEPPFQHPSGHSFTEGHEI
jgi:acyl carrier protein